jgi:hypothetical protein
MTSYVIKVQKMPSPALHSPTDVSTIYASFSCCLIFCAITGKGLHFATKRFSRIYLLAGQLRRSVTASEKRY